MAEGGMETGQRKPTGRPVSLNSFGDLRLALINLPTETGMKVLADVLCFTKQQFKNKYAIFVIPATGQNAPRSVRIFEGKEVDVDKITYNKLAALCGYVNRCVPKEIRLHTSFSHDIYNVDSADEDFYSYLHYGVIFNFNDSPTMRHRLMVYLACATMDMCLHNYRNMTIQQARCHDVSEFMYKSRSDTRFQRGMLTDLMKHIGNERFAWFTSGRVFEQFTKPIGMRITFTFESEQIHRHRAILQQNFRLPEVNVDLEALLHVYPVCQEIFRNLSMEAIYLLTEAMPELQQFRPATVEWIGVQFTWDEWVAARRPFELQDRSTINMLPAG